MDAGIFFDIFPVNGCIIIRSSHGGAISKTEVKEEQEPKMPKPRYLTKSRFKTALDCETKLFFTNKKEYANQKLDDTFLQALANGGFQVGELAKFRFCDDPYGQKITITSLDYDTSIEQTHERLKASGEVVIAEPAFKFENFFVRCDIVVKKNKTVYLYEVKSKSWQRDRQIMKSKKSGEIKGIDSEISDYVHDVVFQKWVIENALKKQGVTVRSFLLLVDKDAVASVDGLNQRFKIVDENDRTKVVIEPGLTKKDLGNDILVEIDTDQAAEWIFTHPIVRPNGEEMEFEKYLRFLADNYKNDKRIDSPLRGNCKDCEFSATPEEMDQGLKSGFHECWKRLANFKDADFDKPLTLDLWSSGFRGKTPLIEDGKYFLKNLREVDIRPKVITENKKTGLSPHERRMLQIKKSKDGDETPYLDRNGLRDEIAEWVYPLHLIDFETCTSALPFYCGRRPYEGIAFQFSHHMVSKNGNIAHAGQFISFEPGVFPNYAFLRELKNQLSKDNGSIFRYHCHENTFLAQIYRQLALENATKVKDRDELMAFICLFLPIRHPIIV